MLFHHFVSDALRVAVLLALVLSAMPLLRRASSATRRLVLAASLGGVVALPLLSAAAPSWHVQAPDAVASLRAAVIPEPLVTPTRAATVSTPGQPAATPLVLGEAARSVDLTALLACLWAAGATLVLARLLVGLAKTRAIVRRATPARVWSLASAHAWKTTGQRADVRMTDELDAPAVAGMTAPVVLVPEASASWTDERRYAVLLHELAHVRQRDCLAQVVAQLACAVHWFNPLVWLAARRLRVERELAADDAVVAAGARASSYAEDLLAIASAAAGQVPSGALGMAERSLIATRVRAIVAARRGRRPPTRVGTALLVSSVGAGVLAIACATPETVKAPRVAPSITAAEAPAPSSVGSTIDPRIQAIAEEELDREMNVTKAAAGTVLVLDPATGEILANAGRDHGAAADVAVRSAYVTGSTLKAFTLAAALEENVVSPTDRFDCEQGVWTYHGQTLHDSHAQGVLTVPELLAVSSNIGFAKIFDRLGGDRLGRWLRAFHFGTAPAVEGATAGWIPSADDAMLAIGESLKATPLQVAAAYGALANGGYYVAPTLTRRTGAPPRERILEPQTASAVTSMLEGVVSSDKATGTAARVEGQRVAGKTGTASWTTPDGSEGIYASFVGFVPAQAPRFVILVGLEQPQNEEPYGGTTAAPVFSRVATRALAP
jgi:beta-lactamase regulating signal transducer with metallopeptidase domain